MVTSAPLWITSHLLKCSHLVRKVYQALETSTEPAQRFGLQQNQTMRTNNWFAWSSCSHLKLSDSKAEDGCSWHHPPPWPSHTWSSNSLYSCLRYCHTQLHSKVHAGGWPRQHRHWQSVLHWQLWRWLERVLHPIIESIDWLHLHKSFFAFWACSSSFLWAMDKYHFSKLESTFSEYHAQSSIVARFQEEWLRPRMLGFRLRSNWYASNGGI